MYRLGLALLLLCAVSVFATSAEAQCGQYCQGLSDLESGKHIGYACLQDPDNPSTCVATATTCNLQYCGGFGLILDTAGNALATVALCEVRARDLLHTQMTEGWSTETHPNPVLASIDEGQRRGAGTSVEM